MMEEILPDLYRIEVPLPGNPLKSVNSYLFKSKERNLIVDTGMNRPECRDTLEAALDELGVNRNRTDYFITHLHADHLALVPELASPTSVIFFNRPDAAFISRGVRWEEARLLAEANGFPAEEARRAVEAHPGVRYGLSRLPSFTLLAEGNQLKAGRYHLTCIETPGHSEGHLCLYERQRRFLISGDHLLGDITPNISLWTENQNPLRAYLASLNRIYRLEVDMVLPGHRRPFSNCRNRIDQLQAYHYNRAQEVRAILETGEKNAYQVAAAMHWDLDCEFWDLFPVSQKWFATGEALAHLKFLEDQGQVRRVMRGKAIQFVNESV